MEVIVVHIALKASIFLNDIFHVTLGKSSVLYALAESSMC